MGKFLFLTSLILATANAADVATCYGTATEAAAAYASTVNSTEQACSNPDNKFCRIEKLVLADGTTTYKSSCANADCATTAAAAESAKATGTTLTWLCATSANGNTDANLTAKYAESSAQTVGAAFAIVFTISTIMM